MRVVPVLALLVCCSCGRTASYPNGPGCVRQPSSVPSLPVQTINGQPRLWSKEACIKVTYTPTVTLNALKPTLQGALDAWGKVDCSGLCFQPMQPFADPPTADQDLRLHLADTGVSSPGGWELLNDGNSGRSLHATIYVNGSSSLGDVLRQLGHVLGFEGTKHGADTVLDELAVPSPRVGLGALDRQSVCAVYPPCR